MNSIPESIAKKLDSQAQKAWDTPIVCRVEVDVPGWLEQLTGLHAWEMISDAQDEQYLSFFMRSGNAVAEVTLYHTGQAQVEVNGAEVFSGQLKPNMSEYASLAYFNVESGETILLQ